jgi:SM-20-related protein
MPAWLWSMSLLNNRIVESIAATGCYLGPSLFDSDLVIALRARLILLHSRQRLLAAQVGRARTLSSTTELRGDSIAWLNQDALDPAEARAMTLINSLRLALNRALYIGAVDTECHYARYPIGAFYKTHFDRFGNHDLRVVSLVFYLNAHWRDHEGGELLIHHPESKTIERVMPRSGTMVAFLSAQFPHEVLPATRPRLALSGWMRRRAMVGQ